ncbi:Lysine--tRNA ligase [Entamoeba marina]
MYKQLFADRSKAIQEYQNNGYNPWPHKFHVTITVPEFIKKYNDLKVNDISEDVVSIAGRALTKRSSGNSLMFIDLHDSQTKVQVLVNKAHYENKEEFAAVTKMLFRGDIGATGHPTRSKTGELSLLPTSVKILSPCLHILPTQHYGLDDLETRFRKRYLDMIVNPESVKNFYLRSKVVKAVRSYLDNLGFLEVETPILNSIPGGATARPFITHHNQLNIQMYMRIAPELYLKELVTFRNEGIDMTHNPEFTTCEFYMAYADYNDIMSMTEELLNNMVKDITGGSSKLEIRNRMMDLESESDIAMLEKVIGKKLPKPYEGEECTKILKEQCEKYNYYFAEGTNIKIIRKLFADHVTEKKLTLDFTAPFRRISYVSALEERFGEKIPRPLDGPEALSFLKKMSVKFNCICSEPQTTTRVMDKLFGDLIEEELVQPTFVIDQPQLMSPLAKYHRSEPELTERFELFILKREIANAYTELNNPIVQRQNFESQAKDKAAGDDEAQLVDEVFLDAVEHGLPPTGGWGLGIDRLTMLLADTKATKTTTSKEVLDGFQLQIKIGQIVEVGPHPNSDHLLAMKVNVGEDKPRSIVAGLAEHYKPEELLNQKASFVCNLKPSKLRGVPSEGMILAATSLDGKMVKFCHAKDDAVIGSQVVPKDGKVTISAKQISISVVEKMKLSLKDGHVLTNETPLIVKDSTNDIVVDTIIDGTVR